MARKQTFINKFSLVTALIVVLFIYPPLLLAILPGILFFYHPLAKKSSAFENIIYTLFLSISFYIVGFWLLKYLPINLTTFIYAAWTTTLMFLLLSQKPPNLIKINSTDVFAFVFIAILFVLFGRIYFLRQVASGADMATHSYIARVIEYNNAFPSSYEPFVPISTFGSYPFGLPLVSASVSLLTNLPVYKATLALSLITYVLLACGFLVFLTNYFKLSVAIATTVFLLLLGRDITIYLAWGGNPTIMGMAFLLLGVAFFIKTLKAKDLSLLNAAITAVVLYASFSIHQIPLISTLFLIPILALANFFTGQKQVAIYMIKTAFLLGLLSLTFLSGLEVPQSILGRIFQMQNEPKIIAGGSPIIIFLSAVDYVRVRIGGEILAFGLAGMVISKITKLEHGGVFFVWCTLVILQIANSKVWFLPLSPLLYPDRLATILQIPLSVFVGYSIDKLLNHYNNSKTFQINFYTATFALFALYWAIGFRFLPYYQDTLKDTSTAEMVTSNDLAAFSWIQENTEERAIFLNNYGDAGIWLPAIAGRKVKINDAGPYDLDEVERAGQRLKENYVFIGDKVTYPNHINLTKKQFDGSANYKLLFEAGEAKVYQVVNAN